jgi:hypothetical protein
MSAPLPPLVAMPPCLRHNAISGPRYATSGATLGAVLARMLG